MLTTAGGSRTHPTRLIGVDFDVMQAFGKLLVLFGAVLCLLGAALWLLPGHLRWLGRLPGDFRIGNSFYFPLATCLVVSLALTLLLNLLSRLLR